MLLTVHRVCWICMELVLEGQRCRLWITSRNSLILGTMFYRCWKKLESGDHLESRVGLMSSQGTTCGPPFQSAQAHACLGRPGRAPPPPHITLP